jgi:hypothetical protein
MREDIPNAADNIEFPYESLTIIKKPNTKSKKGQN